MQFVYVVMAVNSASTLLVRVFEHENEANDYAGHCNLTCTNAKRPGTYTVSRQVPFGPEPGFYEDPTEEIYAEL